MSSSPSDQEDKLSRVQQQVSDLEIVALDNVTRTIKRGHDLEDLDARSEQLDEDATRFLRSSRAVRRNMCWRSYKLWGGIAVGTIVLIIIVVASVAGSR